MPTCLVAKVAANVVLNALSTEDEGRPSANSAAAELFDGTTRESKVSKFSGLVMSMTTLPASWSPYSAMIVGQRRVGHGEHDDVTGDRWPLRRNW